MTEMESSQRTLIFLWNKGTCTFFDVCKKLELNPLRFGRDMRVLSKKNFPNLKNFRPANEKRRKSNGFQDFPIFFLLHGQ